MFKVINGYPPEPAEHIGRKRKRNPGSNSEPGEESSSRQKQKFQITGHVEDQPEPVDSSGTASNAERLA